jgi:hypothetical protein
MKKFKIQPEQRKSGVLPTPLVVNDKGFVGRQKFWQGTPKRLLGFNSTPQSGDMDVAIFADKNSISTEDMMLGIGNYAVFIDDKDNWFTFGVKIADIQEVITKKRLPKQLPGQLDIEKELERRK